MAGNGAFLERESETNANEPTNPNGLGSPEGGREPRTHCTGKRERVLGKIEGNGMEREERGNERGKWHTFLALTTALTSRKVSR